MLDKLMRIKKNIFIFKAIKRASHIKPNQESIHHFEWFFNSCLSVKDEYRLREKTLDAMCLFFPFLFWYFFSFTI